MMIRPRSRERFRAHVGILAASLRNVEVERSVPKFVPHDLSILIDTVSVRLQGDLG